MQTNYNCISATTEDLQQAEQMARALINKLVEIQWILTTEQQRGIYSLIQSLDWEIADCAVTVHPDQRVRNKKLIELLNNIKCEFNPEE